MITKARHYLKTRQSKLQHEPTFGLMVAKAEDNVQVNNAKNRIKILDFMISPLFNLQSKSDIIAEVC